MGGDRHVRSAGPGAARPQPVGWHVEHNRCHAGSGNRAGGDRSGVHGGNSLEHTREPNQGKGQARCTHCWRPGFTDIINSKITQWQGVARGGITLIAIVVVGIVFVTKRALVPVLGAVVLAAIALWAVWNTDFLRDKTQQEFNNGASPAPVVQVVDLSNAVVSSTDRTAA